MTEDKDTVTRTFYYYRADNRNLVKGERIINAAMDTSDAWTLVHYGYRTKPRKRNGWEIRQIHFTYPKVWNDQLKIG